MRRNKDGSYNLRDLRSELAKIDDVRIYNCGGGWIVRRWVPSIGSWYETPADPRDDERAVLQDVLGVTPEPKA